MGNTVDNLGITKAQKDAYIKRGWTWLKRYIVSRGWGHKYNSDEEYEIVDSDLGTKVPKERLEGR